MSSSKFQASSFTTLNKLTRYFTLFAVSQLTIMFFHLKGYFLTVSLFQFLCS